MCGADRGASSLYLHGGGPPLLALCRVTSPALPSEYSCYLLWDYCYVGWVVSTTWKGASTPPLTLEVTMTLTSFPLPPSLLAPVAWIWDVVVMLYMYIFAPDYITAQQSWHWGRHQLRSVGLATVICQVLAFLGLGLVPTADSPDTGPLGVPPATSTWAITLEPWMGGGFFSHKYSTPADCSSRELCLRKSPDLGGGETLPVRPGTSSLPTCTTYWALSVHVDLALGTLEPLGQASKFFLFSAWIASRRPMLFHDAMACLNVNVDSLPP